jgi:hypothetical protein
LLTDMADGGCNRPDGLAAYARECYRIDERFIGLVG